MKLVYFVITWLVIVCSVNNLKTQENNMAFVKAICDYSHTQVNGALEQRCGDAQDKTNTEYLCATRSFDNNCWVEQK